MSFKIRSKGRNQAEREGSRVVRIAMGKSKNSRETIPKYLMDDFYLLIAYILTVGTLGTILLLAAPTKNSNHIPFIDALYNSFSAVTGSGLASVAMSDLSTFQLTIIMFLCLFGGKVFTTILEVYVKFHRCKRCKVFSDNEDEGKEVVVDVPLERVSSSFRKHKVFPNVFPSEGSGDMSKAEDTTHPSKEMRALTKRPYKSDGDVLAVLRVRNRKVGGISEEGMGVIFETANSKDYETIPKPKEIEVMREKSKDEANVYKLLGWTVFGYWAGLQTGAAILARIYIAATHSTKRALKERNTNATFFAIFMTISHFANAGFAPINDNMMPFVRNILLLFIYAVQMLFGNTLFPVGLRGTVWAVKKWVAKNSTTERRMGVLLGNPQKYSSMLYPKGPVLWFLMVTIGCVALQTVLILALMWNEPSIMEGFSIGQRLVSAWFQAVSCRHTGVNIWNLALWSPTLLFVFGVIMYVPSQPLYTPREHKTGEENKVWFQLKRMAKSYAVILGTATLLICIIENDNVKSDPVNYSILNIVFEVISGGMNVGLSVGYTCALRKDGGHSCVDVPYSFSGKWSPVSKLVVVGVMVVGRVR